MHGKHIKIFDTTLRDGQQCPGAGMSFEDNLRYAKLACDLRVDILEAGFPSASALDFDIVHTISKQYGTSQESPIIAGLCQLRVDQIERTVEALAPSIPFGKARLHTYVPVDPELMVASLGERAANKAQIVRDTFEFISIAVKAGCEVQFSPEGYSRVGRNFDFTTELIRAAIDAGATVINCPDTIGGACKLEGESYFVNNMKRHAETIAREYPQRDITWSVHCHNDFGLAVENTMNAVFEGPATQIEGCINGIGERAGNAALEQCIMIVKQFGETAQNSPCHTTADTSQIQQVSDFVHAHMLPRQPHWPVSGHNAAKHSSGGHTNAILKNPMAYQPFDPQQIGNQISFVFGPLSGGNHAKSIIEQHGYVCTDAEKAQIAQFIKDQFKQRRKGVTDDELMSAYFDYRCPCKADRIDYSRSGDRSTVRVYGSFENSAIEIAQDYCGKDSALAALKAAMETYFGTFEITSHRSHSEGGGTTAHSRSFIMIVNDKGEHFEGTGFDQDIEISAMKAMLDALNRSHIERHYKLHKGIDVPIDSSMLVTQSA
jgi:2-isopropylmalate synthase